MYRIVRGDDCEENIIDFKASNKQEHLEINQMFDVCVYQLV